MQADIKIPYGVSTASLRCTLGAAIKVCDYFGDFVEANKKIASLNLNAFAVVVGAALDKEPKEVREPLYQAGLLTIHDDVTKFLNRLANGGRDPGVKGAEAGGADSGKS